MSRFDKPVPPAPEREGFSPIAWGALENKAIENKKAHEENKRRLNVAVETIAACVEYEKKLDAEHALIVEDMRKMGPNVRINDGASALGTPYIGGAPYYIGGRAVSEAEYKAFVHANEEKTTDGKSVRDWS